MAISMVMSIMEMSKDNVGDPYKIGVCRLPYRIDESQISILNVCGACPRRSSLDLSIRLQICICYCAGISCSTMAGTIMVSSVSALFAM
jgi:hypothetical protein